MNRRFRLTCAHGLEILLAEELAELGFRQAEQRPGSVLVTAPESSLAELHRSRLASRVWMILVEASSAEQCLAQAAAIDWARYRWPGDALSLVVAGGSFADLSALQNQIDSEAPEGDGGSLLKLRLAAGWLGLELDCSGADMHQRGYRLAPCEAPLDENFAVACLRAAEWQVGEPLYDPCCGAGAFVIEAALMARPSSRFAPWHFSRWPGWAEHAPLAQQKRPVVGLLLASDQAFAAYNSCRDSAQAAGLLERISLHRVALEDMDLTQLPKTGLVTAHPPYDHAQGGDVVRRLLARFHGPLAAWRLAVLLPETKGKPHGNLQQKLSFMHAGRRVVLWVGYPGAPC
ncbi:MAG: hypothetical protein OSB21_01090 [Myxococcota bacterium]|nr:hypothetical protein [Myxococcota bacterium]